jgi:hypothetical protein
MLGHALISLLGRESELLLRHSGKRRGQRGRRTCVSTVHVGGVMAASAIDVGARLRRRLASSDPPSVEHTDLLVALLVVIRNRSSALASAGASPSATAAAAACSARRNSASCSSVQCSDSEPGDHRPASVFWIIEMLAVASRIAGVDAPCAQLSICERRACSAWYSASPAARARRNHRPSDRSH